MKKPVSAWQLLKPYWVSEQKWVAISLLILVIALDMSNVYAVVQISFWQKNFFDALADYKLEAIMPLMFTLFMIIGANITVRTFSMFFEQMLEIRWRSWLTHDYVQQWLNNHSFYHIEQNKLVDNPDQRISEDLGGMATKSLSLFTGLIKNCVNLVSYSIIIWNLSDTWVFSFHGTDYVIPGAMLWIAIAYAFFGSYIMEKIGRSIVSLDYKQQQYEADFRSLLMNIRKNSEQISLYQGQSVEEHRLKNSFSAIRQNWRGIMTYTKRIAFTESIYIETGSYLPYFLIIPQYFAKKVTIGGVMQLSSSFSRIRASLSWFIFNYKEISDLRATLKRLGEFKAYLDAQDRATIENNFESQNLSTHQLILNRPNGELLTKIPDLTIEAGTRLLIQGESGVGKSTLLRALAGIWTYGQGKINLPDPQKMLFIPQKIYLPIATLKQVLSYPNDGNQFSQKDCEDALQHANLSRLIERLDQIDDWGNILSLGEQQRLAFAKIFLHQPTYVFLDEATSALDLKNEMRLYAMLDERLPNSTIVSIAHHAHLEDFHHQKLLLPQ